MLIKQIWIQNQSKASGEIRILQLGTAQLMCRCNLSPWVIIFISREYWLANNNYLGFIVLCMCIWLHAVDFRAYVALSKTKEQRKVWMWKIWHELVSSYSSFEIDNTFYIGRLYSLFTCRSYMWCEWEIYMYF